MIFLLCFLRAMLSGVTEFMLLRHCKSWPQPPTTRNTKVLVHRAKGKRRRQECMRIKSMTRCFTKLSKGRRLKGRGRDGRWRQGLMPKSLWRCQERRKPGRGQAVVWWRKSGRNAAVHVIAIHTSSSAEPGRRKQKAASLLSLVSGRSTGPSAGWCWCRCWYRWWGS